ncbi:hypothetical protein CBS147339_1318 [Penicillium roqueforti]|nr:hypothetical protein DTO012A8_9772 [Penicillium roqueforti]KAI3085068.1 hypothetical protein CBS147339_1318 [Penicillium roqueforti]KAI3153985.1 hypothetical protein CBS147325_1077 [Penicillium roqueforti]KAI3175732.1 hypothetical protein DTO046C5_2415 [Penicillium roqueforti]KAI3191538.1 hypothetical protein DTO032C6_1268 [Penicillium roqueforti]
MDDSFPQTDCEARTDREARSPSPPSSASYSTDTTTSPVKPAGPMGFFAAVGDSSSSAPSSSSPTSDGSFAPRVDGLTQVITAIGLTFGRESGSPDELSFGDDGGPDRGAEVSVAAETVRQVQFLLRYGDYAGMVWNVLRKISRLSNTPLPDTVVAFDAELDIGEEDQAVEELGGPPGAWQILRRLVDLLNNREGIQIDESMARSAIKAYALRNKLCHSSNLRDKCPPDIARDAGDCATTGWTRCSDPLPYVPTMEPTYSPSRR